MSRERDPRPLRQVLLSSLRGRGSELRRLAFWSAIEAIPAFLSGRLVANAIDDGFLAGRTGTGFMWLGVLALSALVGAWGTRHAYLRLAELVEPFRDELVERTVTGALHRSTTAGEAAETAGVARLTQQVEIVREAYASILMVVQGFLVTTVSALIGLLTLVPEVLVFVLPPLVLGLALFFAALAGMASRQRASIMADEQIAEATGALTGGLRDVIACGAEGNARASVGRHIDAQARATRELARFTAMRTVAIALGGLLPLVLILAGGSWLIQHGPAPGRSWAHSPMCRRACNRLCRRSSAGSATPGSGSWWHCEGSSTRPRTMAGPEHHMPFPRSRPSPADTTSGSARPRSATAAEPNR